MTEQKRFITRKKVVPNLPFPGPTTDPSATKTTVSVMGVTKLPTNERILERGESYKGFVDKSYPPRMDRAAKFFLTQVAPELISLKNGLEDAREILRVAFEENPDVNPHFTKLETIANLGIQIKMVRFMANYLSLSEADATRLMDSITRPSAMPQKSNELQEVLNELRLDREDRKRFQDKLTSNSPKKAEQSTDRRGKD